MCRRIISDFPSIAAKGCLLKVQKSLLQVLKIEIGSDIWLKMNIFAA